MNAKLKLAALTLGIVGVLVAAAGAQDNSHDLSVGNVRSDRPVLLATGGSSPPATGSQNPPTVFDPESPAPEMAVAEPLFEFGQVLEGTKVAHDFLIENRGSGDLLIDQVRTG
ncbi:MAG: hypothetical protein JJV98_01465 [Desulfosarcina sp.]|nr:hypothetical protein [Desulfobacterales bacterium]